MLWPSGLKHLVAHKYHLVMFFQKGLFDVTGSAQKSMVQPSFHSRTAEGPNFMTHL